MAREPVDEVSARVAAIRAQRQERDSAGLSNARMRLQVREEDLDRENWQYRFVNDVGNRVYHLKGQGYEVVSDRAQGIKADGVSMGAEVAQLVDTTAHGAPIRAILMRQPKPIFEEDQRAKHADIDKQEASRINLSSGEVKAKDETRLSRNSSPSG